MKTSLAWSLIGAAVTAFLASGPLWAAKPPSPTAVKALQRVAEQQGHPQAAVRDLKNFGHSATKEVEAAAAGVKVDAIRRAGEQNGPLTARLETARGKKLSPEQSRRIVAAEQEHLRHIQSLRSQYHQVVAKALRLPEAKIQQALARDQGEVDRERQVLSQLEKLLARRLTASEVQRIRDAGDAFRDAMASQRDALAAEIGKISGLPAWVVKELLR